MTLSLAHVGPDLPIPLLRATGRHIGALPFDPDHPVDRTRAWIEGKFPPWAFAIMEQWAAGDYDTLGQILFSRADDTAQRLYYYACELQRRGLIGGPEPLILDVAKIPRESSLARTIEVVRRLADRLGVDEAALRRAIEETTAPGTPQPRSRTGAPLCLLTGTPPPDRRLHEMIARAGWEAVGPTMIETWEAQSAAIDSNDADPLAALATQIHAAPSGPRAFADPGAALRAKLAEGAFKAIILWQIEEDEAQAWHLPAQRAVLRAIDLPALVLTRRDWLCRDKVDQEIDAFLKGTTL